MRLLRWGGGGGARTGESFFMSDAASVMVQRDEHRAWRCLERGISTGHRSSHEGDGRGEIIRFCGINM